MMEEFEDGVRLHLYVQPGGKKSEVLGEHDGSLKIRVKAPPVEGKANAAVIDFVASIFSVPRARVSLLRGQQSRLKVVAIDGLDLNSAAARLATVLKKFSNKSSSS